MASFKVAGHFAASLLFGGIVCAAIFMPAVAQEVNPDQILKALSPAVTRGLSVPAEAVTSDADHTFTENLRHHACSLDLDESDHVAELAKERPQIDLNIYFNYNSAAITAKAEPQLKELGKALSDPRLENATILIGAHTDARGSDKYNQKLSERRAEAVRGYLVDKLKIPADNLSTAGYGKRNLKNKADPFAAENRRVQIVNLGPSNAAKR